MNKRTVAIINELNQPDRQVQICDLAEQFQVSQRTIRNDLNAINEILQENDLMPLELKGGGLIQRGNDFGQILELVSEKDYYVYRLSKEERKKIAAAMLISSSEYITLSTIADNLQGRKDMAARKIPAATIRRPEPLPEPMENSAPVPSARMPEIA